MWQQKPFDQLDITKQWQGNWCRMFLCDSLVVFLVEETRFSALFTLAIKCVCCWRNMFVYSICWFVHFLVLFVCLCKCVHVCILCVFSCVCPGKVLPMKIHVKNKTTWTKLQNKHDKNKGFHVITSHVNAKIMDKMCLNRMVTSIHTGQQWCVKPFGDIHLI